MTYKVPIYLSKLIKKYPTILSGRKNVSKNIKELSKQKN